MHKTLHLLAVLALLLCSAQARAIAVDTLSVNQASLLIDLGSNGIVDYNFSTGIFSPPADITMGLYQGLPGGIISMTGTLAASATIYTTGAFGQAAPTGDVTGNILDVDLSSLRAQVVLPLFGTLDFALWPLVLPPSLGTYNETTGAFSLGWDVDFSHGLISGTATVSLGGHLTLVPLPAALWLMGSGLLGLFGIARARRAT